MAEIKVGGVRIKVPDDATVEDKKRIAKKALATVQKSPEFEKNLDKETGAPNRVRAIVGSAREEDRLVNIKRFFPDAAPFGKDNFVYTDPATGKSTLYNPEGLDTGDVFSVAREGAQMVGSGLGAVFGAGGGLLVGAPTGPGAIATAAGGGVLGAGAGSVIGGSLFDVSMNLIAGRKDTTTPFEAATDTALEFGTAAVGQKAGDLIGVGVKRALGGGTEVAKRAVQRFQSLSIEPPAGAVSRSRTLGTVEKLLEITPGSADIMQESAEKVLAQTAKAASEIAEGFGKVKTPQGAGETIRSAAIKTAERFKFTQEKAYDQAFNLIGADTPVAVNAIQALRETMEQDLARAPRSLGKALKPALRQLRALELDATDGLPFDALRQVRTAIGRDINQVLVGSSGAQNEAMKRMYGALTADMSAAARAAGPEAARKLAIADRFTRQFMNTAAKTLEKITKFDADEKAFRFAMSSAQDGGTALARLRRNFTAEEWDTVAGTVLGRLGKATPSAQDAAGEVFSVSTFMTNWNKLAPEAKTALFGGKRYKELAGGLDTLVDAVSSLKGVERLTNTSNTARNLIFFTTLNAFGLALGGLASGDLEGAGKGVLVTAVGGIVAPRLAAKLITSPSFVKWLTTPVTSPNGVAAHLARLVAIGKAEPLLREGIDQFIRVLVPTKDAPPKAVVEK